MAGLCVGICDKQHFKCLIIGASLGHKISWKKLGYKYCKNCDVTFKNLLGIFCPCCKRRVRFGIKKDY